MSAHFDHNATSPLRPKVARELGEWILAGGFGNPSSPHATGRRARAWIEDARDAVAISLGADPRSVTFTSGATESNHAAISAFAKVGEAQGRKRILASPMEHPSVLEPLSRLENTGFVVEWSPLDDHGRVNVSWLSDRLNACNDVAFVVCMAANNETGVIQPWTEWSDLCVHSGVPILVDGTQIWGRRLIDLRESLPLGCFTASGHKLGGISGSGIMVFSGLPFADSFIGGGPQERGRRGGTENLLGIRSIGLLAQDIGSHEWLAEQTRITELATWLEERVALNGRMHLTICEADQRLANTLHLRLPIRSEMAVMRLDMLGFAVSAGSACSSGSLRPSPVLLAMGWSEEQARHALRISLGWSNDHDQVQTLWSALTEICGAID